MVRGGVTYAYVKNHLGTVKLVVNATTGAVVQRIESDVWGNVLSDSNPGFQPFVFAGGVFDNDTRLTHFGFRDYDASSGSWLSPEPMLQDPKWVRRESERGFSAPTYAYARNNSIRYTDPTGLCVSTYDCCMQRNPGNPAACGGFAGPKPFELPKFDPKSMLKPFKKFAADVCKVVAMSSTVKTCTLIGIGLGTGYCLYDCGGERRTGPFSVGGGGNSCEPTLDYDKTSSDVPDFEWTMFPP
jgi:RHS repeat-associated protein